MVRHHQHDAFIGRASEKNRPQQRPALEVKGPRRFFAKPAIERLIVTTLRVKVRAESEINFHRSADALDRLAVRILVKSEPESGMPVNDGLKRASEAYFIERPVDLHRDRDVVRGAFGGKPL
jgi:hypothetical protein